jgi:hypothetical protein
LSIRKTGRVLPLVENRAIKTLRVGKERSDSKKALLQSALSSAETYKWHISNRTYSRTRYSLGHIKIRMRERESSAQQGMRNLRREPLLLLRLRKLLILTFIRELRHRIPYFTKTKFEPESGTQDSTQIDVDSLSKGPQSFGRMVHSGFRFLKRLAFNDPYMIGRCLQCLHDLKSIGVREVALLGTGPLSQIIALLSPKYSIKVTALYASRHETIKGRNVYPLAALKEYKGKVIIASFEDVKKKAEMLKEFGIKPHMIVDLW